MIKFGQSLKAVTSLEGLLKAKTRFLAFINREEGSRKELKKAVYKEWDMVGLGMIAHEHYYLSMHQPPTLCANLK